MTRRPLLLAIAIVTVAAAVLSAQQVTFRARREVVRVDVLVTDHGNPVHDLKAADFEIRDNGVAQTVDYLLSDEQPVNVILGFDLSQSVAGERLDHLRRAGRALLDALRPGDRAGLIGFSHAVDLGSALTPDRARVQAALDHADAGGGTSLVDASYAALVMGETDQGRSLVITFSDGVDTSSWLTPAAVLDTARRAGTVVYGASVRGSRSTFLRDVASVTGGSVLEVDSTRNLDATFVQVLSEFRQRYVLGFSPQGVTKDGWHRLEVRVKSKSYTIKARPGYLIGTSGN